MWQVYRIAAASARRRMEFVLLFSGFFGIYDCISDEDTFLVTAPNCLESTLCKSTVLISMAMILANFDHACDDSQRVPRPGEALSEISSER
jgi:hypothetical protein